MDSLPTPESLKDLDQLPKSIIEKVSELYSPNGKLHSSDSIPKVLCTVTTLAQTDSPNNSTTTISTKMSAKWDTQTDLIVNLLYQKFSLAQLAIMIAIIR